jgi:hypothetical protein
MVQRTFIQHAQAYGTTPASVTVRIDGQIIYEGPVNTLNQPSPQLPDDDYHINNLAWSWEDDADFSGTKELSIAVQGSDVILVLAETLANNPYMGYLSPAYEYRGFWSITVDGIAYEDPLTDVKYDGVPRPGPYDPYLKGQWWWRILGGTTMTAVMHVNAAPRPYIVFDSLPQTVVAGDQAQFTVSIPEVNPEYPLPRTYRWQVVDLTTTSADFLSTSGNVTFDTAQSGFVIDTVNQGGSQSDKEFTVHLKSLNDNILIQSSQKITIVP